ncbi:OsmC family protein [Niastella populi]|uniref:Osmotically inducible protein OsmC n=1 Tax=Niastella populi TaxID=550983 RepID=A0A1V9EKV8_9BACT|nr:OsmC family protein [Niastella populi]OQP46682.1 osmotically inducible protein OsmC [Niastella populi]
MIKIELERVEGDFGFEAKDANGHTVRLDTSPEGGGTNFGVRPMQMLLMGLGGCSGIDIVNILKKQRQTIDGFNMKIEGEREAGKEPSIWKNVTIVFELTGNIDPDKARRACELSMDKYCSVAETLRRAGGELKWEVRVNQLAIDNKQ